MARSACPTEIGQARYAPPGTARWPVAAGLALAYLGAWWIGSSFIAATGRQGHAPAGRSLQTFDLARAQAAPARRAGRPDGVDRSVAPGRRAAIGLPVLGDPRGTARIDSKEDGVALAAALADVLGDDPVGEGDMLHYRTQLLEHLRRFTRYPAATRASGIVMIRFRIGRDGTVIDSRIVSTHDAVLDGAALDAVWRASPLPAVPVALSVPCEIDVPIAFRAPGALQRRG